ncbi:hypothetical protein GCM10023170_027520 [Phytohabitans houttuyneae]|uniref:DUF2470 domain-containing protein n=1 Tax=Phytohabitans houttuyneae TaxID=1076126 RepID=UPI0031E7DAB7
MQPSPAEVARTLAAGRLPGNAHIACRPSPHRVRHATDAAGRVLMLVPAGGDLAESLRPGEGADDVAVVLDVQDAPPVAGSPSLGRVWVSGWAAPLAGVEARQAAQDFVDIDPLGDLLDVGRGQVIFRMEPAEVRLETGGRMRDIDPDEYAAAEPDPLQAVEWDLLTDLADHHVPEMADFIRRQLADSGHISPSGPPPRVVRLDRYGFVVALGAPGREYRARLAFPRAVADRADLARLLHPVLCRRCSERTAAA